MHGTILNRIRKLVFKIRSRTRAGRFAENIRRVNRMARLMTIVRRAAPKDQRATK